MKKVAPFLFIFLCASAWVLNDATDPVSRLRERLKLYSDQYKRAKLDLVFNQPKYGPGDTVLVRTLYFYAADLRPVEGRQIVNIDFMDQNGTKVLHNQILVLNGKASNSLVLPNKLAPGIYMLVAYSEWMRNLDPALFFRQDFLVTRGKAIQDLSAQQLNLEVYPEGGSLISGVENNVVVRFNGDPKQAKVVVRWESGELPPLLFDANGLAEIKMTPVPNVQYTAELQAGGQIRKFNLPAANTDGFAIETKVLPSSEQLVARIRPGVLKDAERKYFFAITNNRGISFSRPLEFTRQEPLEISIPEETPAGVAQIMIVDDNLKVWMQRLVMIPGKTTSTVRINPSKKVFGTREPARVEIEVVDKVGNPVQGNFTVRITNQDLFKDTVAVSRYANNTFLYSDVAATGRLKGRADIESVNRYLVTQTCPWLPWNAMEASRKQSKPVYSPQGNMVISGTLTFFDTGEPVPDSSQVWFFLQKQIFGYEVVTDDEGAFQCPILFDFAGADNVFFSASRKGNDLHKISLKLDKQDSTYGFMANRSSETTQDDAYGIYQGQKKIIDQSFSFFTGDRNKRDSIADPNAAIEEEFQGADQVLTVSDFVQFPTMEDVIRELLRGVDYRKIRGRDVIRVYTTHKAPTNFAGPLYVIDGVLTKDPATFLSLKPSDIITIKVIKDGNKLIRYGSLATNGVILVRRKNWDRIQPIRVDNTFPWVGMLPTYPRAADPDAQHPPRDPASPILKPCLFWGPQEKLDANGRSTLLFDTSDDVGNFKIHIEGVTANGEPFLAEETFQVKYDRP